MTLSGRVARDATICILLLRKELSRTIGVANEVFVGCVLQPEPNPALLLTRGRL